jgi:hypothetical protein
MTEKQFTQSIQEIMKAHQPQQITIPADRINTLVVRIDVPTRHARILDESGPFTYEHERDAVEEHIDDYLFPGAALLFGPAFKRFVTEFENMVTGILEDYFFIKKTILTRDEDTGDVVILFMFIDKDDLQCD